MFGFISNFKKDVVAGFDAVHQRLVTLEAQVAALFEHTKVTAETEAKTVETTAEAAATTVEAIAPVATAVETAVNDAKQV